MSLVALVGMAGSGKSEAARFFTSQGYKSIRFGDATDIELKKHGLPLNEENERKIREQLRKEHGMAAYAIINLPRIDEALEQGDVVIDGLYSWEEYLYLKDYYKDKLQVLSIWASPKVRAERLARRKHRPLTAGESASRDKAEVEKLNKTGPIAMADYTIINHSTLKDLEEEIKSWRRNDIER